MSTEPQPATQAPVPSPRPDTPAPPTAPISPGQPAGQGPGQPAPQLKIKHTRISGLWLAVGFFALVLLFLLIFILENGKEVAISYLGAHGHLPLGVALLLSAVCGVLLTVLAGAARIAQLHSVARRHRRADARQAKAAASVPVAPADSAAQPPR
jgi:uncharacterized integral membrane protein